MTRHPVRGAFRPLFRSTLIVAALAAAGCAPLAPAPQGAGEQAQRAANRVFDGGGYRVVVCDAAHAGRAAACNVSGSGPEQVVRGNIVSGGTLMVGGTLVIGADGRIRAAGCQVPAPAQAVTLDCPGALVSPGFVNLHEHIDYSYQQPPQPPVKTWQHRHEWRRESDAERGFAGDAPKDAEVRAEVSERAMLRHALSGTTSLSGAKNYRAFLRNLQLQGGELAMPAGAPVQDDTFPMGDAVSKMWPTAPCTAPQVEAIRARVKPASPYVPHVGEGVNDGARIEVDCVLDAVQPKPTPNAFIHGVAIGDAQIARLVRQNVGVVLSPRSNLQLYGVTAPLMTLRAAGVTLALGTDWSPSGSLTQLDEARCLVRHSRARLQGALGWAEVHRMMTEGGARAVGLQGQVGSLAVGELADMVIFDTRGRRSLGEVLEHSALAETVAVFVGGRAASFPRAWEGRLPQLANCAPDPRDLCGQQRTVCGASAERPLGTLLRQTVYTIDDGKICRPQPTDDCVGR